MLGTIDELVFDCGKPGELAAFWAEILGGHPVRRSDTWWYVDPPGWMRVAFQKVPEEKQTKNLGSSTADRPTIRLITASCLRHPNGPHTDLVAELGPPSRPSAYRRAATRRAAWE